MDQAQSDHCPVCGKSIDPQWKSCPECGLNLDKELQQPPAVNKRYSSTTSSGPVTAKKGFPTWGWLLIFAGGFCCLVTMLLLFGVVGYMLLKPDSKTESPRPTEIFTLPALPDPGEMLPGELPLLPDVPSDDVIEPESDVEAQKVEVVNTWFVQDPDYPTYVMFGSVLRNPNMQVSMTNVELQAVAYDTQDNILATGNLYAYVILPGEELAVGGSGGLTVPEGETIQKVEVKVTKPGKSDTFALDGSPFDISNVFIYPDERDPLAVGTLTNRSDKSFNGVMITAIALDAEGNVIGGSSDYNDVYLPANASIPVIANLKVNGETESVKMYASFNAGMEIFEQDAVKLPVLINAGAKVDEYGTLRYTVIIENPSKDQIYQYLPGRLFFFGEDGKVIGGTTAQLDTLFPGDQIAFSSSTMLPYMEGEYKISKVEYYPNRPSKYFEVYGLKEANITANPLSVEKIQTFPGEYDTRITCLLRNGSKAKVQARVVAVLYDSAGNIIGGGEGYPPEVPGNDEVAVEINLYQKIDPAKVEVYTAILGVPTN